MITSPFLFFYIMNSIEELVELVDLKQLTDTSFQGGNYKTPWGRVYGGQVLAQALQAAYRTVPADRFVHSLHGYFILPGNLDLPIIYEVDTIRDGGSFTTRRIVAKQNGKAIFNMSASFCLQFEGLEHQIQMPAIQAPEELINDDTYNLKYKEEHPEIYQRIHSERPVEFRRTQHTDHLNPENREPMRQIWTKVKGTLPDDIKLHQVCLAYISDYNLMGTGVLPHRKTFNFSDYNMVSLDHAMWFHKDFDMNQWLLYDLDSPNTGGGRTFGRGHFFCKDGKLIASVAQEGLLLKKRKK